VSPPRFIQSSSHGLALPTVPWYLLSSQGNVRTLGAATDLMIKIGWIALVGFLPVSGTEAQPRNKRRHYNALGSLRPEVTRPGNPLVLTGNEPFDSVRRDIAGGKLCARGRCVLLLAAGRLRRDEHLSE